MSRPVVFLVVGVVIFVISLAADAVGIGEGTGIGWKQITGAVVGAIIAVAGIVQMQKKTEGKPPADD
jgi:hypothetical protein